MKKSLLFLLTLIIGINLNTQAHDFAVENNGDTIYYKITSSSLFPFAVAVTYRGLSESDYSNEYSGSVSIPDSVQYNGNYYKVISIWSTAFCNCSGLTSITLPNFVTAIGYSAFYNCSGLTSIIIPSSVISIGQQAFENCTGLYSITIPTSVEIIYSNAFNNTLYYNNLPNGVVYINNVLYKYKGTMPANTTINIQQGTISISGGAFSGCGGLISITIPNSVTSIGGSSFYNCTGLTSITIPNSVTSIGNDAFSNTPNYNNMPDGLVYINNVLYKYKGTMPANTSINVLSGTISISDNAFNNCNGLISISIPNSVTSIGTDAFYDCDFLSTITIPNSVTSIGSTAFASCNRLDSIILPNSITYIDFYTFASCPNLRTISIPSSVTSIGEGAFYGCSGLTSITIPNSITSIGAAAFWSCHLTSITIPSSIVLISPYAFNNGTFLTSITSEAITPPSIFENSFSFLNKTIPFYVPCNSVSSYQTTQFWNEFTNYIGVINTDIISASICEGETYSLNGFNASTSGIHALNLESTNGCDSIVTLNLFLYPSFNDTIFAEICNNETYLLNGFNEDTTGFYTQNLQTTNGCDSIVNLSLIVNHIYNDTIHAEICSNQTYTLNGFNVNIAGFYTQNLQTINGCDSIVNLSLIVNPIYNDTITAIICQGDTYFENGFSANTTGFYTQTLQTTKGCDSIVNLSLTVTSPPNIELDMVTVDLNNHNEVIWNKNEIVNHYNIYREGNVAGQYDLIATVLFDSVSMFIDTNSNPTIKAYMYKISTTDTCLNESALSPFHKTMHLTIGQGMGNNWNLNWTPYVGANYSTYNIYRGINSLDSLQFLTTISSSNTSYTDINVPSGYVYYQIEIIIDTTQTKAGENNSIRSNYATNDLIGLNDISSSNITTKLYPNPTNNKAKLEVEGLSSEAEVLVYDMIGRVIQTHKINKGKNELEIDLNGYAKGVYSIRIMNDSINQTKKLIVK